MADTTPAPQRLTSLDAFRGFTIAGMIFVNMASGYHDLPQTFPAFGSAPVSTWKHAGEDYHPGEWAHWHGPYTYQKAHVVQVLGHGKYDVEVAGLDTDANSRLFHSVPIRHPKPLRPNEDVIAVFPTTGGEPTFQGVGNGCTFTDLIAPFFVFIVGVAIPLSRQRRGAEWWKHVGTRTLMLIAAGVLYICLAFKGISWWWGILQAIGVAYFLGALFLLWRPGWRCVALGLLVAAHAALSWYVPWWTHLPADKSHGFFTLSNLSGDKLAPLNAHCTPWGSVGYGIATIIGTFIGEALSTREPRRIIRQCILVGGLAAGLGYLIHRAGIPMNKSIVSVSYALFTAGVGALCFLALYWLIDVKQVALWAKPLNVFGSNALLGFFLQPLVRMFLIQLGVYALFTGRSGWTGMAWGLIWTLLLWCVCLYCNKREIYWKL